MLYISCKSLSRALIYTSIFTGLYSEGVLAMDAEVHEQTSSIRKQPVQLLVDGPLDERAMDLAYWQRVLNVMGPQMTDVHSVENLGTVALKMVNANGFGTSMMILDSRFESDASTNFIFPENFMFDKGSEIAHGTAVAATAASKHPEANALAAGTTVYPILSFTQKSRQEQQRLEMESEARANELFAEMESISEKRSQLLAQSTLSVSEKVAEYCTLSTRLEQIKELIKETSENYGKDLTKLAPTCSPLSLEVCDTIEGIISYCKTRGFEVPRVINVSLGFEVKADEFKVLVERLSSILNTNDILLVNAAGNEAKELSSANVSEYESRVNLHAKLKEYPDLLSHMLLVGGYVDFNNEASEESNRAGFLKEHTLFALGCRFGSLPTLDPNGLPIKDGAIVAGTSFASPRAAALAAILHKYFPHLSMQDIKAIILRTAFKHEGYDEAILGQGGLNPIMAWIEALKTEAVVKKGLLNKLQGLFKKK